jgi:DNA primase
VVPLPPENDPDDLVRKQGKEEFLNFIQNNRCTVTEYRLENYIKSGLSTTWDGKVKILWDLFPEIDQVKSILARDRELNNLAHRLSLPESDVTREFTAWKRGRNSTGSIRNRNSGFRNNRKREEKPENSRFEEKLLAKMIIEPDLFKRIKKELGIDFFSDPSTQSLALIFDKVVSAGETQEARDRFNEEIFADDEINAHWARICILEEEDPLTQLQIDDYIRDQQIMRERLRWQGFAAELRELEINGDFFSVLKTLVRLGNMTYKGREGGTS